MLFLLPGDVYLLSGRYESVSCDDYMVPRIKPPLNLDKFAFNYAKLYFTTLRPC